MRLPFHVTNASASKQTNATRTKQLNFDQHPTFLITTIIQTSSASPSSPAILAPDRRRSMLHISPATELQGGGP